MKYSELKRWLRKSGCYLHHEGGNHEIWYSPITGNMFPVGRHDSEESETQHTCVNQAASGNLIPLAPFKKIRIDVGSFYFRYKMNEL